MNGIAERKNRSLKEMANCMLIQSNLDRCYWAEALNTANYLQNRLPTKFVINKQSSEQVTISCGTRVSKIPKYLDT